MAVSVPLRPLVFYFGTPVVLLTTTNQDGSSNITPISSAWALGSTYVLGLLAVNHGARNLARTGELVINLPDAALATAVETIAPTTGAPDVPAVKREHYRHTADKWALGGLTPLPSREVAPPRIAECPVQLEARVVATTPLERDAVVVQAEVLRTWVHADLVVAGTQHVDLDAWRPLYYTFRHYFAQGRRVGTSFKAEQ